MKNQKEENDVLEKEENDVLEKEENDVLEKEENDVLEKEENDVLEKEENDVLEKEENDVLEKEENDVLEKKIKKIEIYNTEEIFKINQRIYNDIQNIRKFCLEKIIIEFLPIIDNIERALNLLKKEKEEIYSKIIKNVEFTNSILNEVLNEFNIEKINNLNVAFNPSIHQAMSISYTHDIPSNQVVSIMQPGYTLYKFRLLRPALVVVSKNKK